MNLCSPADVRLLLNALDVRPNKALGQNFLIDRNVRDRIVEAAAPGRADTVLEIGPGLGVLTEALLALAGRVVAVEKDPRLAAHLRERLAGAGNLTLIEGDALELGLAALCREAAAVVSNLPYTSGSRMLVDLALAPAPPARAVVTVQKEVAGRLAAGPGGAERGLLTLHIQRVFDVELLRTVSATCFWPAPDVASAVVRLTRHDRGRLAPGELAAFSRLVKAAFEQRRKQLRPVLARRAVAAPAALDALWPAAGLDPKARAEDLTLDQWLTLARGLSAGPARH